MSEKGSNNPKMLKLDVEKSRKRSLEDLNESYISDRKIGVVDHKHNASTRPQTIQMMITAWMGGRGHIFTVKLL